MCARMYEALKNLVICFYVLVLFIFVCIDVYAMIMKLIKL